MDENTSKQRDITREEYGKDRAPRRSDGEKTEYGKVRESRESKPIMTPSAPPVTTPTEKTPTKSEPASEAHGLRSRPLPPPTNPLPRPAVPQITQIRPTRRRIHISTPVILGVIGVLAAVTLIILGISFWNFGQWVFGIMTSAVLIGMAVWIYTEFDTYIPTIWISFALVILNVVLFFILREAYDIMATLISLGLAVMFFLCVPYAYDDAEEGYGAFSAVLMSAVLLFATAAPGGLTLLCFFACWMPGVLIALLIACLMMDVDGICLFHVDLPDGYLQAITVTVVTLLIHLLFEVVSPVVIGMFAG